MTKKFCFGILLFLVFASCKISKIKSDRVYHDSKLRWPTVILYKDSIFGFNYVVPSKFDYIGPSLFPEKYFITKGKWRLKRGVLTLTSSSDSLAHNIESSHPTINPVVKSATDPRFSTFDFSDHWGDTVQINQVQIDNKVFATTVDTAYKSYKIDMTTNIDVLTFHFKNYEPYIFRAFEKINKNYRIGLEPKYSSDFFKNDTFHITQKNLIDIKRKLVLVRLR